MATNLTLDIKLQASADTGLDEIERLDAALEIHFKSRFYVQPSLTRSLVSFQANKNRPVYRWYKYKEGFSASLVEHFFQKYQVTNGKILDPFAGSGTALFTASAMGLDADGIELLPIGQQIISTKRLLENEFTADDFDELERWIKLPVWQNSQERISLNELRITAGAYPENTKEQIEKYLAAISQENERVRAVLFFALLCVLEIISYTRKDGQYLRWDYRSGRKQGKKQFDKGEIVDFEKAISGKVREILADLQPTTPIQKNLFAQKVEQGRIHLFDGSSLDVMPKLPDGEYDAIITSPPYCNRHVTCIALQV